MTNPIYFFNIKVMLWVKGRKLNHFWQGMSDASREVLRRHSNPHPRELYYYILCMRHGASLERQRLIVCVPNHPICLVLCHFFFSLLLLFLRVKVCI